MDMTEPIVGSEDLISSDDIERRINFLADLNVIEPDEAEELTMLREVRSMFSWVADRDWRNGAVTFVSSAYWVDYCEEFAYSIGEAERDGAMTNYINWESFAADVRQDYVTVDVNGNDYYARG